MSGETKIYMTRQERLAVDALLKVLRAGNREGRPVTVLIRQTPPGIIQCFESVLISSSGNGHHIDKRTHE